MTVRRASRGGIYNNKDGEEKKKKEEESEITGGLGDRGGE